MKLDHSLLPTRIAVLVLGLALLVPALGQAEGKESFIQITGGSAAKLPLALPPLKLGSAGIDESAALVRAVVQRDLTLSGYFDLLADEASIEPATAGIEMGEFDFSHWQLPGAVGLAKSELSLEGGLFTVRLHVYDVDAAVEILARSISGADPRRVAHRVSNAIVEAFTGKPGMFDTRVVAIVDFGSGKEVYTFDYDGENRRSVSRNGSINLSPSFSPDGSKVAYTSYRDNNPDLWVTDLRSGRHTKLSARPGINAGAEWSPDGTELALTLSKDQDSEIYALGADGSIVARLTRDWGIDVSPSYSPDGSRIAFVSSRFGTPQIFLMKRDGTEQTRLTRMGGHNVAPSFSPDGSRIAFAGRDEGRFDIFVINTDGSGLRRLTQSAGDDEDPTWSPDGNHILFSSSRGGRGRQLYIMTADGSHQARVTDGRGSYTNPMWGPSPQ
jgi:TolB protein